MYTDVTARVTKTPAQQRSNSLPLVTRMNFTLSATRATPNSTKNSMQRKVVTITTNCGKKALYRSFLKKIVAMGVPLVCVDNACFTLAELGLLNGHQVVVHWRHHNEFRTDYPQVAVREEQLYHFDGKVIKLHWW